MSIRKEPDIGNCFQREERFRSDWHFEEAACVDPGDEDVEHLRIFGGEPHKLFLGFLEASVERRLEVSGLEAENAFESLEGALVVTRANFDLYRRCVKVLAASYGLGRLMWRM